MSDTPELKPCPFCFETPEITDIGAIGEEGREQLYSVFCTTCAVGTRWYELLELAIDKWNARASDAALAEACEIIEALLAHEGFENLKDCETCGVRARAWLEKHKEKP